MAVIIVLFILYCNVMFSFGICCHPLAVMLFFAAIIWTCSQDILDWVLSHWAHFAVHRFICVYLCVLCVFLFLYCIVVVLL